MLLTSGGTRTPIDEVRHVGNLSNGTFGCHLCNAILKRGHETIFIHAKGSKTPHECRINLIEINQIDGVNKLMRQYEFLDNVKGKYYPFQYQTFDDYKRSLFHQLSLFKPDVVILAAAVSDYAPVQKKGKISSELKKMVVEFEQTPKLIRLIREVCPKTFLVGFKLLVGSTSEQLLEAMKKQMDDTKANMVVGNDLRDIKASNHRLTILYEDGLTVEEKDNQTGENLASFLIEKIICDAQSKIQGAIQ